MTVHTLKSWPEYFEPTFTGKKTFEVRRMDRPYKVGDVLYLKEFEPTTGIYTGRECVREITYTSSHPDLVEINMIVLGIKPVESVVHFLSQAVEA